MKKVYEICKSAKPEWEKVEGVNLNHTAWLPEIDVSAVAKACYNDEKLYLRLEAKEEFIREELTGPYQMVCEDSCLEFFFAPMPDDERYFNFEFNPKGAMYLGFGTGRILHARQIVENYDKLFSLKTFKTEKGWGVEFEIPYSFIRLYFPDFKPEGKSHCNFYKCGDKTRVMHYLSWSDMTGENPDFHRRCDFSEIIYK